MHSSKKTPPSVKAPIRPKKRKSNASERSKRFSRTESAESLEGEEEEEEPYPSYNYREELTYLFFTSAIADIIESRESIFEYPTEVEEPLKLPSIEKDIQVHDVTPSKSIKPKRLKSASRVKGSKKSIPSMMSLSMDKNLRNQSVPAIQQPRSTISLRDETVTSVSNTPKKKKRDLDWIVKPRDKVEKIVFKNGNIFEGETSRWLMHGRGVFLWSDRTFYKGDFKDGYPDGEGTITLSDLSTYEGNFKSSLFDGVGTFSIAFTHSTYNGSWKHGKKNGFGWCLYDQDNWYEGEWFEDKRHGKGLRRYSNGAKYNGTWRDNQKDGEGSMVWKNNDLYVGEWKDNKFNGYGEYTWNAPFTNLFIYPYCSWYKGNWVDGVRNGAGVMNFGTVSGARLAGIWKNNRKHGPGVMVCGNGLILQCNPLFVNDKTVHLNLVKKTVELENTGDENLEIENGEASKKIHTEEIMDETNAFRKVIKQIYSKIHLSNFDCETLQMITQNGLKISEDHYIKLENSSTHEMEMFRPLEIPIHTVAEQVDLTYFVDVMWNYYFPNGDERKICKKNISRISGILSEDKSLKSKESFRCNRDDEEKLLRNLITGYLPNLLEIYQQYAIIMTKERYINCRVLLIRLFLWQLLRDVGLPRKGVSLVDADEFIAKNPRCCLESDHCPFEVIYFWQFIQALVGCSWLLHTARRRRSMTFGGGVLSNIFRQFLEDRIFRNAGKFEGYGLTLFKNLVPMTGMYELYLKLGEPHTVNDFLFFTVPEETEPLCFPGIDYGDKKPTNINEGTNIVVGDKILYLQAEQNIAAKIVRKSKKEKYTDRFYNTLYTLRILGKTKIINCLQKVCAPVITRGKVNLEYNLTFLDFYETLLLCAYEKTELERKAAFEAMQQELNGENLKPNLSSNTSKLGNKKKKHK